MLTGGFANRQLDARVDIVADGFWNFGEERAFLEVHVFNPYSLSIRQSSL